MSNLILNVATPERAMVSQESVDGIVVPGTLGQLTILPGHVNFITAMKHGIFAYRVAGANEWQIAFLSGGFAQAYNGNVTILAETMELAAELDVAAAELEIEEWENKIKSAKVDSPDYASLVLQKELAEAKLRAAEKKIH